MYFGVISDAKDLEPNQLMEMISGNLKHCGSKLEVALGEDKVCRAHSAVSFSKCRQSQKIR